MMQFESTILVWNTTAKAHERVTVHEVVSEIEHRKRWGHEPKNYHTDEPCWMVTDTTHEHGITSLNDHNVGASYNPWLIFADKETAEQCRKELQVDYERDPWLDDYERDPWLDDYRDSPEWEDNK